MLTPYITLLSIPLCRSKEFFLGGGRRGLRSMAKFSDSDYGRLLLCDESEDLCFDDLAVGGSDGGYTNHHGSNPSIRLPVRSEASIAQMIEREIEHLPKDDYLRRLRSGQLDSSLRRQAFDWISKAHDHYRFGPLSLCLSMNYLDRFLSLYHLPEDKAWAVQILALACLSIAVKMEETTLPQPMELQVAEPKFLFQAKTIQRMEVLVLCTLEWKMNAITPCSFIDYFLIKIGNKNSIPTSIVGKSIQLILRALKGLDFLEFRPSETAFAAAVLVAGEIKAINIDEVISPFLAHVQKGRIVKCIELMKDLSLAGGSSGQSLVPKSPVGVLEAKCFSTSRCDETTGVASCANSNNSDGSNPDTNRKRLDLAISGEESSES